jgi:hypothetical protein
VSRMFINFLWCGLLLQNLLSGLNSCIICEWNKSGNVAVSVSPGLGSQLTQPS